MKNLNSKAFQTLLTKLGACAEAVKWSQGLDLKTVWESCERGDWLLWLVGHQVGKAGWPSRQQLVLAACACAETALKYVPKDELCPKQAIDAARRWAKGDSNTSLVDVRKAAYAARAARAAAYAAAARAAAYAAYAAADAAYTAYAAADAAYTAYAADAARAAAYAARAADAADAAYALKECAELVRQEIKLEF